MAVRNTESRIPGGFDKASELGQANIRADNYALVSYLSPPLRQGGTEDDAKIDTTNQVTTIGYVGKKRYVRLSMVTANSANLTVGAVAVQAKGKVPSA